MKKVKFICMILIMAFLVCGVIFQSEINAEVTPYTVTSKIYENRTYTDTYGLKKEWNSYTDEDIQHRYELAFEADNVDHLKGLSTTILLPLESVNGVKATNYSIKLATSNYDIDAPTKDGAINGSELDPSLYTQTQDSTTGMITIAFDDAMVVNTGGVYTFNIYVQVDFSIEIDEASYYQNQMLTKVKYGFYMEGTTNGSSWLPYAPNIIATPDNLILRAVDSDGNDLVTPEIIVPEEPITNSPYATSAPELDGYTLVATPNNASGLHPMWGGEVVYEYQKDGETIPNPEPEIPVPEKPGGVNTGDASNVGGLFTILLGTHF